MRVAFVGKGGAGKSTVAGMFARHLARAGEPVLAVDTDPLPGLALSLGLGTVDAVIPDEAVVERGAGEPGPRFRLREGFSPEDAVAAYSLTAPDGVRFLQFGKARSASRPPVRAQWALRLILDDLPVDGTTVVGDLPGGTRQPFLGWAGYAETILVVVPPTAAGVLTARRLAKLAEQGGAPVVAAVVNQAQGPDDAEMVGRRTGLDVLASIPWDERVSAAERRGLAVLDDAPDSPAVGAVADLAQLLLRLSPRTHRAVTMSGRGGR